MILDSPWFQFPAGAGVFFFLYFLGKGIGSYLLCKGQALKQYMERCD